ncbi:YihY family inner membrane protein [Moraxella osloensis]|nr:YhjD/YihY/BrkB family envelope integrity protein [Moraxella osloensis]MBW4008484.1 YihY family inner membrane protein [Moraxella osloensis]
MNELIAKLKKLSIFKHKWVQFLMYLIKNFIDDNCSQKAALLTYTTLLSIVPILTLLVVILSTIPQLAEAREQIQNLIFSNILPSTGLQVTKYLNQFTSNSSNLTIIGVGILFFTTISTLMTIETAFNQIWRVEKKETSWLNLVRYWVIITLLPIVLALAMIVSSTVQSLSFLNQKIGGYGIDWAIWVQIGSIAIMLMGLVAMYWFVPRCQVRFKHALVAGVVVGIIFEILKLTFGAIVDNFTSYKAVYGAFAILPLFLLWIYISWNIILLGVQISYCLTIFETKEIFPRHALFSLMDMLNVLYREHKKGNVVTEAGLRDVLGRQEMPNWYTYISFLQDNNLITTSDKDEYVLKRSLDDYSFWEFYQNMPYPLPHEKDLRKLKNNAPWTVQWINTLARGEAMLKYNFDVSMASIFDSIAPRQTPNTEDIEPDKGKKGKGNKLAGQREGSGLSGGQVSDVINEDKRIKETDAEQATGFDGTLDFKGQGSLSSQPRDFNALNNDELSDELSVAKQAHDNQTRLSNDERDDKRPLKTLEESNSEYDSHGENKATPSSTQSGNATDEHKFAIDNYLNANNFDNMHWDISNLDDTSFSNEITTTQTVKSKILADEDKAKGDNTAVMAKIRQIVPASVLDSPYNPFNFIKSKIAANTSKKSPRIITEKDKPDS